MISIHYFPPSMEQSKEGNEDVEILHKLKLIIETACKILVKEHVVDFCCILSRTTFRCAKSCTTIQLYLRNEILLNVKIWNNISLHLFRDKILLHY